MSNRAETLEALKHIAAKVDAYAAQPAAIEAERTGTPFVEHPSYDLDQLPAAVVKAARDLAFEIVVQCERTLGLDDGYLGYPGGDLDDR
jgi:uracil-DNA glycosylase